MMVKEKEEKRATIWNRTFICMIFCQVCLGLSQYIVNPLVSSYARFLGAGAMLVGLTTGLYYGVAVLLRPFGGPAIVRLDKRKLLIFTFSLGAIVNLAYAVFDNITLFIIARACHGIQFSVVGSLLITVAGDSLPRDKMGSGLGIYGIGGAISTAIGPAIGLAVRSWGEKRFGTVGGYKALFFTVVIVMIIAIVPCTLARPLKRTKEEIASTGAWYKNIIAVPALPPSLCNMFFAISYSLFSAYMVPYAEERGFVGISLFFTIYSVTLLASRPIAGKLTDKYGAPAVIYPGGILFIIAFLMLWRAQSVGVVYSSAFIASLGYGACYPSLQSASLQSMPAIKRGVAGNTSYFGMDFGLFIGPTLGGAVISHYLGTGTAYSRLYLFGVIPIVIALITLTFTKKYIKRRLSEVAAMEE